MYLIFKLTSHLKYLVYYIIVRKYGGKVIQLLVFTLFSINKLIFNIRIHETSKCTKLEFIIS